MATTRMLLSLSSTRHGRTTSSTTALAGVPVRRGQRLQHVRCFCAVSTHKQAVAVPAHNAPLSSPSSGLLGGTAVVIGASVAGLLSACALSRHYANVIVCDKDAVLPGATPRDAVPVPRRGVPQSSQPHVVLTTGYEIINSFLPSFESELLAAGALPVDWASPDCKLSTPGGWMAFPQRQTSSTSNMVSVTTSRYLLESVLRRAVARTVPNISWLPDARIKGLMHEQGAVCGVLLADGTPLHADLTVHAAGRSAPAAAWLRDTGLVPAEAMQPEVVDAQLVYTSREYLLPPDVPLPPWKVLIYQHDPPRTRRIGYLARLEGRRLVATLGGYQRDVASGQDEQAWLSFAKSLHGGGAEFLAALQHAVPATALVSYAGTANMRRRYPAIPGLIHVGDCVMALDPAFGQGISCAALAADALRTQLAACAADKQRWGATAAQTVLRLALANTTLPAGCEYAWQLALAQDTRFDDVRRVGSTAQAPPGLLTWYIRAMRRRARVDPVVSVAMVEAVHHMRPPTSLIVPGLVTRVLAAEALAAIKRTCFL